VKAHPTLNHVLGYSFLCRREMTLVKKCLEGADKNAGAASSQVYDEDEDD
jgi:hypothetical protein